MKAVTGALAWRWRDFDTAGGNIRTVAAVRRAAPREGWSAAWPAVCPGSGAGMETALLTTAGEYVTVWNPAADGFLT
ncbi:MAG: hypothetical protein ACK6EB_01655, partial [Planctomyces sp.]